MKKSLSCILFAVVLSTIVWSGKSGHSNEPLLASDPPVIIPPIIIKPLIEPIQMPLLIKPVSDEEIAV